LDNMCGVDTAVAVGNSYILYHGGADPSPVGNCHHSGADTGHSRPEDSVERGNG